MQDELTTSEYREMLAIIAAKPEKGNTIQPTQLSPLQYQSWAKRLRAAFEVSYWLLPGTDEDAIKAVFFFFLTQAAFAETAKVYQSLYGDNLLSDLKGELEFYEYDHDEIIIKKKSL
jgi:hypothetical protein